MCPAHNTPLPEPTNSRWCWYESSSGFALPEKEVKEEEKNNSEVGINSNGFFLFLFHSFVLGEIEKWSFSKRKERQSHLKSLYVK